MPRLPINSGSYRANSFIANMLRRENLYIEKNPENTTPQVPYTLYPRPGSTPLSTPPVMAQARCLYTATNGALYAVLGQNVYYIDPNWTWTQIGTLVFPSTNPAYIADNGTDAFLVDGSPQGYVITLAGNDFSQTGDPNFLGADRVDFIDYFLVFNQPGTQIWYSTLVNSVAFNALYFGQKTAWPDNIISLIAWERQVLILGPYKGEIWTNTGGVPFAFSPNPGSIIEYGIGAKYSLAKQVVFAYWLGQNPEGARMVLKIDQNGQTSRISNHALETELLTYARVDDAVGNCYQIRGHSFYRLHFPTADRTWVFDEATQEWFEDVWRDVNGIKHRSRIGFSAYAYGKNVGLDWSNGALYLIDETNFTDNGTAIECLFTVPHVMGKNNERQTLRQIELDMEIGNGPGVQQAPTQERPWSLGFSPGFGPLIYADGPTVSLRVSRRRGAQWDNARAISAGGQGLYDWVPTWWNLGMSRDFVFEFFWATPMKTACNGPFVNYGEEHEP